jgi:uncharacterized membrane protein YGL010W
MRSLTDHLSTYALYHRDRRNIATHFVGIPMIVVGLLAALARPELVLGSLVVSPAVLLYVGGVLFYLALDLRYGVAMALVMAVALGLGVEVATLSKMGWIAGSAGLFVVGWVIQFVGHLFEGKKPAFVDDLVGLLVGPLFVTAEAGFALGLRREVLEAVEQRAGPTRVGRAAAPPVVTA